MNQVQTICTRCTVMTRRAATSKVKRGNSDRILTPGVIPIPECRASFIKVTKLKTAMRTCIASLLTYTETNNHWRTPQYAGDISATVGITPPVGIAPPYLILHSNLIYDFHKNYLCICLAIEEHSHTGTMARARGTAAVSRLIDPTNQRPHYVRTTTMSTYQRR